jgi:hypothetical protein
MNHRDDYVADRTGILVNVTELAVNATFYKRRAKRGKVRILTIHPGGHYDPLSCTLQEHDIQHVSDYTAISYCWTYDAKLVDICVDDNETFKVPVHLRACLRRLRNATSATSVWIDAICINQNDQAEKSEQVGQMPKIYSSSLRTVIWLGETEPDVPTCIVRANGYCAIEGFSSVEHGSMLRFLGEFIQDKEQTSLKPEAKHMMRVWWKRLWCIQEFMLSPRVPKVMAGPHLVRWDDFLALTKDNISPLFKGRSSSLGHSRSIDSLSPDRDLEHDSDHWQGPGRKKSLLELLQITSEDFACSDPKDRIFALIGITNDAEVSIQVDYTRTVEEVYSEAAAYLINAEGNVDMLLDARVSRQNGTLPTWVPQFVSIKTTKEVGGPDAFRASSEKPVATIIYREPSTPCGCTGSCLKLRAVKFDKIVRRVAVAVEDFPHDDGRKHIHSTLKRFMNYPQIDQSLEDRIKYAYHFQVASSGGNSDRLDHSLCTEIKPKRSGSTRSCANLPNLDSHCYRDSRRDDECSFLDCMLETLAVDFARPPLLRLERLPQIGLLFADYLFNGTQSLGKVTDYHHNAKFERSGGWPWRPTQAELLKQHRLPERQALLRDLEVAMVIQVQVLNKIIKRGPRRVWDKDKREGVPGLPESTYMYTPDSGYERIFFKTEDQHLGVGPGDLRIGDEVVVPFGSSRPWVLRGHGDHHVLVGEAFVPGIMTGQLEELWKRGDLEYTDYVLRR